VRLEPEEGIEVERYESNVEIADEHALEALFQQFTD
jgi:hypothetical protein